MRKIKRNNGNYYILKCDISKYFYSIDKDILFKIISKRISDKKLLSLIKVLVYDDGEDVGIPIGNYTSQYFANIYLNQLDWHIKRNLKVKYLVRYMDDFVILVKTKEEARILKEQISIYLNKYLKLKLNPKSNYYPSQMGVNFCGYRIFETHKLLRENSKRKIKKKINKWNKQNDCDELCLNKVVLSWNSWLSHSSHSNSYKLRVKMYNKIMFNELLKKP